MKFKISRPDSTLNVSVNLSASKSIANRLLIIHALAGNLRQVKNLSESDDTRLMSQAMNSGAYIKDVGLAGTSMRFLTAYYSVQRGKVQMTGSERLKERPIGPLVDALRQLGADIKYVDRTGFPPLDINGRTLKGGEISIDSGISSQFISALLMIAPVFEDGLILHLEGDSVSSSYIRMTLELMSEYGAEYNWVGKTINVSPGQYKKMDTRVESDWSGASYWYAMSLLDHSPGIRLAYLKNNSFQGDSAIVNIFHGLGILSEFIHEKVYLTKLANIHPGIFQYDFTNSPDLVQSMAVVLCMAGIPFRFGGTKTLRIKETDRILALQTELRKLGFILETDIEGSFLSWKKARCEPETDPIIHTYHDHRMAMAFSVVALERGSVIIDDPMVVTKSYPGYWDDLRKAGFYIERLD